MNDKLPSTLPDWDLYHALREQWTHEDNLVNHRPQSPTAHRGNWAAKALPCVFGTLWLLAATGFIQAN